MPISDGKLVTQDGCKVRMSMQGGKWSHKMNVR